MRQIPKQERDGAVISLFDRKGNARRRFDFSALGFGKRLAEALARSFAVRYGHRTLETQSQAWRALRSLGEAVVTTASGPVPKLPRDSIAKLRQHLIDQGLGPGASQGRLNTCADVIEWCQRNEPSVVSSKATVAVPTLYRRTDPAPRPAVPEAVVKKVLAACYKDIEEVEKKLALGRRLQNEGARADDAPQLILIHQILQLSGGAIPLRKDLKGGLSRLVDAAGGLRAIDEYLRITIAHAFPFYLAILAQTGANPMALRELRRDCVVRHPLVASLERVIWDKPRAGKEQYVDFPVSKQWSAPSLVRRLSAISGDLVSKAHASERPLLFLVSCSDRVHASVFCWGSIHLNLDRFIEKHGLPNFDLAGFRTNVGSAHHREAGTLTAAQQRLNHVHPSTTSRYTPLADRANVHDQVVIAFQGRLVREAEGTQARWRKPETATKLGPQETLFGFRCTDPFGGRALGSSEGKLCLQFQRCATCSGALIPLDDVRVVARLLATLRHLESTGERAKREGWWDRFRAVYEPTRQILLRDVLPAVADGVRLKAEQEAIRAPLPHLE